MARQQQQQQQQAVRGLDRLAGKKVTFEGKFDWGQEERLTAMARAQGAQVAKSLSAAVDHLVVPDLSVAKTAQKQAASLNAKGASIQVMEADAFEKLVEPTSEEVLGALRGGKGAGAGALREALREVLKHLAGRYYSGNQRPTRFSLGAASLDGLDLSEFNFTETDVDGCSFAGATLRGAEFGSARGCDFGRADLSVAEFEEDVAGSKFVGATMAKAELPVNVDGADFTSAEMEGASFNQYSSSRSGRKGGKAAAPPAVFRGAVLRSAEFNGLRLKGADFDGADLSKASFEDCRLEGATFRKANLEGATLVGSAFPNADFTGANLRGANLGGADLSDARFDGADVTGANLRGAKLGSADVSKAKGYDPKATSAGTVGPALKELDGLARKAKRIQVAFEVSADGGAKDASQVGVDTSSLKYGWGVQLPYGLSGAASKRSGKAYSDAMRELASVVGHLKVRYETLDVKSTKSPKGGKELRALVMDGIAEAFGQPLPDEKELAERTGVHREALNKAQAAEKKKREKERLARQKAEEERKKQMESKVAAAVGGKVADIAGFLKALEVRADKEKIKKATSMLKASGFQLFNDVTPEHMCGVVKSQTDPDLVYACRIDKDGKYACCTQNLNVCGGLRGSVCKHLLVLIIGLVKAGELDPGTIDAWVARTHQAKPELDKEVMGAIFIKYKGAEAGEVDWRPTETLPEDYYAL